MSRRSSAELVAEARSCLATSRSRLADGDLIGAADVARRAFGIAKAQRSHQLMSAAWVNLIEVLAADPDNDLTTEYRQTVEGAFYWAETMPEEIQVWLFASLEPHLESLGFRRLVERGRLRRDKADAWLSAGNLNVATRIQDFHLADLAEGRAIDRGALALERTAAFYAAELFDPEGLMLREAAEAWRRAGRPDRGDFLDSIAQEFRGR